MANNTIEVQIKFGKSGENNNQVFKESKSTSSLAQFSKKSSGASGLGGNVVKGIRTVRTFSITSTLGTFGGAGPTIAVAQEIARTSKKVHGIVLDYQVAASGETMRHHNSKQGMNLMTNPFGYVKSAIWENGILKNLEIARQNTVLDYNRQLTGNLYYMKRTQHNMI